MAKKKAVKAKKVSPLKAQYMKERKRVQSFLRRAKKRGYSFPDDVLPHIPKKVTQASINRLQKLNPQTLYKKAAYTITKRDASGKLKVEKISGYKGRELERKQAGRKGYQNRRDALDEGFNSVQERNEYYNKVNSPSPVTTPTVPETTEWKQPDFISSDEEWYTPDELKVKDTLDKLAQESGYENYGRKKKQEALAEAQKQAEERQKQNPETPEPLDRPLVGGVAFDDEGRTALYRIQQMIDSFEGEAQLLLQSILAEEIANYGAEAVGKALADYPEESRKDLEKKVYYKDSQNGLAGTIKAMVEAIRGTVLSDSDNRAISGVAELYEDWEEY
ncbi:MAG: hypothetical protein LIO87_08750 [Eubacterium sp.]|nr:hypothetical protein [Eubacterium sp.]